MLAPETKVENTIWFAAVGLKNEMKINCTAKYGLWGRHRQVKPSRPVLWMISNCGICGILCS